MLNFQRPKSVLHKRKFSGTPLGRKLACASLLLLSTQVSVSASALNKASARNPQSDITVEAGEIAPAIQIEGSVKDGAGNPLIGVSVHIKGTSKGTITNATGHFKIEAAEDAVLVLSYVGYENKEVAVNGETSLNITLKASAQSLDELVVVGYGKQKKVDLSGSVSTVETDEITDRPSTSMSNALQGIVPGLAIMDRPGDVGGDMGTVNLLGRGNLGSSSPLFVVDGVPVSSSVFNRLNPHDIKSVSVLKDAAAAAIYGSRAAYGVILVTTKDGKEGEMTVTYNGYYGIQTPTYLPDYLGSYQYAKLRNEAAVNSGGSPIYSQSELETIQNQSKPDLYPNNDWYDIVLRDVAPTTKHQLSVSGGGKTRYYLSGSFSQQNSILPGKDLKRYSLRANTQSQVTDKLKVGTNLSYTRDGYKNENGAISWIDLNRILPLTVNKQSNGDWGSITGGHADGTLAAVNPMRILQEGGNRSYRQDFFGGQVNATYTPIEGLDIKGLVSYNMYHYLNSTFTNRMDPITDFLTGKTISGSGVAVNQLDEKWERNGRLLTQATASYVKDIKKHHGKLLLGTSYEKYKTRFIQVVRKNFASNNLGVIDGGSSDPQNTDASGNMQESGLASFFGRFNYSYDDKYIFQANLRVDGSSRFAPGHRWGVYPSFSAAWRLSEENFLQSADWMSSLKVRGSWGKLGNINNVGYYDFYDAINVGSSIILDQTQQDGAWPGKVANPTLSWEQVTMANIGIDGSFWNNKFSFQIDAFNKLTDGILQANPSMPDEMGLTSDQVPVINFAQVRNKGFEFNLSYRNSIGDFKYEVGGNFTRIWNEVERLAGDDVQPTSYWVNAVGQSIGTFYMYKALGLFVNQEDVDNHAFQSVNTGPGDIKYEDINDDGKIDGDDRTYVGNDVPYKYYGIHFSASYKNFDLTVMGQGVMDVQVYLPSEASQAFFNGAGVKSYVLDRWTEENPDPNAAYPRLLTTANNTQNLQTSSFWLFDASYFRVKSISLGYTLPESVISSMNILNLRVYLSSNNPFTIRGDHRLGDFDPESASSRGGYPQMKSFIFGVNLTF